MKLNKYEQIKEENIFTILVDGEEWTKALAPSYRKGAKDLKFKGGFRAKTAPIELIKKNMNPWVQTNIFNSAADTLLKKVVNFTENSKEYKLKKNLEIFSIPDIKIGDVSDVSIEFKIIYFEYPKVTLKKYKKLELDFEPTEVDEKEVDAELEFIVSRETLRKDSKDKVLKKGHIAIFDFNGFIDGKEFPGGKADNYDLVIGSNQFIKGFEDKMIGLKIGEEKDLKLSFPKDYAAKDFAGKDVIFKVKLHEIKEEIKPELNDKFVKTLSFVKANTVKELREYISKLIKQNKFANVENGNKSILIKALLENNTFTRIPSVMLTDEIKKIKEQFFSSLKQQNITYKKFLEMTNQKENDFEVNFVRSAEDIIKVSLLIDAIKKLEKITIPKKVIDERVQELIDSKYLDKDDKEKIENIRSNVELIEIETMIIDLLMKENKSTKVKKPTKKVEVKKPTDTKKPTSEKKVSINKKE